MAGASPRTRAGQKRESGTLSAGSRLRELREKRELTQEQLAELAGMHRNSVYNLEKGISKEISGENAEALAAALGVKPRELGLTIRKSVPRSVRFRQLTPEQRQLIDELMAFPPEQYERIRAALGHVRASMKRARSRK